MMPISTDAEPSKRERAPIIEEEDRALDDNYLEEDRTEDNPRINTIKAKEQEHNHKVEDTKLKISSYLLLGCFLVVVICTIMDIIVNQNSNLITAAFEFAKTIATAVIGYLFATGSK